ncbi:MAG: hypothetical protein R3E97_12420 [Candidatus Eisenbacteria bacterium]
MTPQLGLDERDLAPAIEEIRRILASDEYPEERHRKAAIRRILHASAAGLDQDDLRRFMERIRARFPDRTYESLTLARELEARNRELEEENRALREERDSLSERLRGTDAALDKLWGRMVSGDAAGGRAMIGGSGSAAPRRPDLLEPAFEGLGALIEFAQKLETIAVEVEKSLGPRGARPIDPPTMAELWRSVGRNEGDAQQHLSLIREKLRYLGLLPAATVAGANQSWKGGTRLILEHLDPEKADDAVSKKLPVLRDKAVLDEVRSRFQEFWSQLDKNITHYYRGTFEKVYAEKMEERR